MPAEQANAYRGADDSWLFDPVLSERRKKFPPQIPCLPPGPVRPSHSETKSHFGSGPHRSTSNLSTD